MFDNNKKKTDGKDWDRNFIKEHGMQEFIIKRFREMDWKLYQIANKVGVEKKTYSNNSNNTNDSTNTPSKDLNWGE